MASTIEQQQRLDITKNREHPNCVGCSSASSVGLGLKFFVQDDGGVEATFACQEIYQGYPGLLHGGVTSMLLDAAMTNCLFSYGKAGVTARLNDFSPPLFVLEAESKQNGKVLAQGTAKFIDRDGI
jgi:acyl-coenzyme A thioesterase PaaI-like protein